jgi:acyl carrier protein
MSIEKFIDQVEEEFEELEQGTLKPDSNFREYFEWNSVNALIIIALIDSEYDVTINAEDIQQAATVQDLYHKVMELKEAS